MHIYDKDFIHGELPMTKQEVRAVSIAKLQLEDDSVLIDVGAGTGTIGIEAATYIKNGKVIGIEKEEKGLEVIRENVKKFNLDNYFLIHGRAPENIPEINYDRMFIGGSTGGMREIVAHFMQLLFLHFFQITSLHPVRQQLHQGLKVILQRLTVMYFQVIILL